MLTVCAALILVLIPIHAAAQGGPEKAAAPAGPPVGGGFFPLKEVHRGLTGTAWTVFTGSQPEAMQVEILGVLRGARGPGHDMILAQLHGAKPEYTGVVAGMSGSPVYIGNRLLGSLSLPHRTVQQGPHRRHHAHRADARSAGSADGQRNRDQGTGPVSATQTLNPAENTMQAMETPLVMGGFSPRRFGCGSRRWPEPGWRRWRPGEWAEAPHRPGKRGSHTAPSAKAIASIVPGSAVSAQLVRGDLEIAATCTVTYIDRKQLLACGHPFLQAGPVSLPMTTTEVVATLASPLNAFKIVNTGRDHRRLQRGPRRGPSRRLRGSGADDPGHIRVHGMKRKPQGTQAQCGGSGPAALTPQAVLVVLYQSLLETNESTAETSYHLTGSIAWTAIRRRP
jgi:hypothetical protein